MSNEFALITSMRYDPQLTRVRELASSCAGGWNFENSSPFYMLDYHRDRMLHAANHWKWQRAVDALAGDQGLESLSRIALEAVGSSQEALRVSITATREGEVAAEVFKTPETSLDNLFPDYLPAPTVNPRGFDKHSVTFTLLCDNNETIPTDHTHFKTTERKVYDMARQRGGIEATEKKEILLVNSDGHITEASITTPYFWRDDKWVTPPVESGGQDGTSRRYAVER